MLPARPQKYFELPAGIMQSKITASTKYYAPIPVASFNTPPDLKQNAPSTDLAAALADFYDGIREQKIIVNERTKLCGDEFEEKHIDNESGDPKEKQSRKFDGYGWEIGGKVEELIKARAAEIQRPSSPKNVADVPSMIRRQGLAEVSAAAIVVVQKNVGGGDTMKVGVAVEAEVAVASATLVVVVVGAGVEAEIVPLAETSFVTGNTTRTDLEGKLSQDFNQWGWDSKGLVLVFKATIRIINMMHFGHLALIHSIEILDRGAEILRHVFVVGR
ncbi:hypothetical protein HK100_005212 [Physocladia obscura]|uniref:Uncharacterized protein n=1 Tax=Physocladia obscura TaxID=109957 RepID=A0AAD5T5X0_9FUNG|nr:hypothetical protein HK100_005212 [Physocladia obscura]